MSLTNPRDGSTSSQENRYQLFNGHNGIDQHEQGSMAIDDRSTIVNIEGEDKSGDHSKEGHYNDAHNTKPTVKFNKKKVMSMGMLSKSYHRHSVAKRNNSFIERFTTRKDRRLSLIDNEDDLVTIQNDENDSNSDNDNDENDDDDKDDIVITNARDYIYDDYGDVRMRYEHWVINPKSYFYFNWLAIVSIAVLYNCWLIIVRTAFSELQQSVPVLWGVLDYLADIIYITDIYVSTRTGYLSHGIVVTDGNRLRQHYFRSPRVVVDIVSLLPFDFFYYNITMMYPIIRIGRLLKYYRTNDFYRLMQSRTFRPNLWRILNLVHTLFILIQWFAAFYYMISSYVGFGTDAWVYPQPVDIYGNLSIKYLRSVYWATLTLTTIGEIPAPVTQIEFLFTLLSYFCGLFIFASIVGLLGNVIAKQNAKRSQFEQLLDDAKAYMSKRNVSKNLQVRVQRWFDYSWERGQLNGIGEAKAISMLPTKLKTELALYVHLETLRKVTLFQKCEPEFLHDLVLKMKVHIYTPMDLVCRCGEIAREMYIISNGKLEVLNKAGDIITTLKEGDLFGEIGVLSLSQGANRRTADVRSIGFTELFVLSKSDVLEAMEDYPQAKKYLTNYARVRLAAVNKANDKTNQQEQNDDSDTRSVAGALTRVNRLFSTTRRKVKPSTQEVANERIQRSYTVSGGKSDMSTQEKIRRRLKSLTIRREASTKQDINENIQASTSMDTNQNTASNTITTSQLLQKPTDSGPVAASSYSNLAPFGTDGNASHLVENVSKQLEATAKDFQNMLKDLQMEVTHNMPGSAAGIGTLPRYNSIDTKSIDIEDELATQKAQELKQYILRLQEDITNKSQQIFDLKNELSKMQCKQNDSQIHK